MVHSTESSDAAIIIDENIDIKLKTVQDSIAKTIILKTLMYASKKNIALKIKPDSWAYKLIPPCHQTEVTTFMYPKEPFEWELFFTKLKKICAIENEVTRFEQSQKLLKLGIAWGILAPEKQFLNEAIKDLMEEREKTVEMSMQAKLDLIHFVADGEFEKLKFSSCDTLIAEVAEELKNEIPSRTSKWLENSGRWSLSLGFFLLCIPSTYLCPSLQFLQQFIKNSYLIHLIFNSNYVASKNFQYKAIAERLKKISSLTGGALPSNIQMSNNRLKELNPPAHDAINAFYTGRSSITSHIRVIADANCRTYWKSLLSTALLYTAGFALIRWAEANTPVPLLPTVGTSGAKGMNITVPAITPATLKM